MLNPVQLEEAYAEFVKDLTKWVPEGIIDVNLHLLQELGLVNEGQFKGTQEPDQFPHYFHVIETNEKVTLFNHQFAVWIVPQTLGETPITITLISLITGVKPHLEIVFSTAGVYNTPKFVLRVLRHYLTEVIDTESVISTIEKN